MTGPATTKHGIESITLQYDNPQSIKIDVRFDDDDMFDGFVITLNRDQALDLNNKIADFLLNRKQS